MSLKNVLSAFKTEGDLIKAIDSHLVTVGEDADRGHDFVSPSSVFSCIRSQMYRILGYKKSSPSPRLRRIFDNGTGAHERLQDYLTKANVLKIPECPIFCPDLKMTGHADGILQFNRFTFSILEIKTINSDGFRNLKEAKPEHVSQASAYLMAVEDLRKNCAERSARAYLLYRRGYINRYKEFMDSFVQSGHKYTKEEKIGFSAETMEKVMDILRECQKPVNTMHFLYENKDTQDLKEFVVTRNEEEVAEIIRICKEVDSWRIKKELPPRPEGAVGKSCGTCRGCFYKDECYK